MAGVGSLLIIGLFLFMVMLRPDKQLVVADDTSSQAEQSATNKKTRRVFIQDFYKYKTSIDMQTQRWIEYTIYGYQTQPDLYTGIIRPGSFSDKTAAGGLVVTELLVDVEPGMATYKVTVNTKRNTDFQTVDIVCAPTVQQAGQSAACQDGGKP